MKCFLSVSETECRFYISDEKDKVTEKVRKLLQVLTICEQTSLSQPFFLLKYEESENAKAHCLFLPQAFFLAPHKCEGYTHELFLTGRPR